VVGDHCRDELVLFDGTRVQCSERPRHRYQHQHVGESIDGRGNRVRYFLRWDRIRRVAGDLVDSGGASAIN